VDLNENPVPATRRRGKALEDALLDAAWNELVTVGYAQFTVEGVAERAETSRHVVYRRWKTREELARAAVGYYSSRTMPPDFNTGSLRGDLIAYLDWLCETRLSMAAVLSVQFGTYFQDTGTSLSDLRSQIRGEGPHVIDTIVGRAVARGEADRARLTPRVMSAPIDLIRNEVMMTLQPVPMQTILEIVDEVFLPLAVPQKASDASGH
jgi:AcrR family transcriptional regulator